MLIGFNTAFIETKDALRERVKLFSKFGCTALEFSAIQFHRLGMMINTVEDLDLSSFKHISVHAPVLNENERIVYRSDEATRQILNCIDDLNKKIKLAAVVVHPDQVEDWSIFDEYDLPFAVENMDRPKLNGKTVEEMENIFKKINAKMVVDLMHGFTNDESGKLNVELQNKFKDKIIEFHLSGRDGVKHVPCFKGDNIDILKTVMLDRPIIIESVCENDEEYTNEWNYIIEQLKVYA